MMAEHFPFREQFRILIDSLPAPEGNKYSIASISDATGLSEQTLQYLLEGRTQYPVLDSARKLCRFFGISLDYFECETEAECHEFLAQNAAQQASSVVREIEQQADVLTQAAKGNVLRLLERFRYLRGSGKH
ncbi:MAG: helix-turn-helix domain-containing protein [Chloroflexota bacterium]